MEREIQSRHLGFQNLTPIFQFVLTYMCMTVPTERECGTICWHAYIFKPIGPDDFMISLLSDNMMTIKQTNTYTVLADVPSLFFLEPIKCLVRAQTGSDTTWCISGEEKK